MSRRRAAPPAPSLARWSRPRTTFMTGRMPITSPLGVSRTTARLVIASIVRIPTSGALMIGIVRFEPSQPVLSIVNVPPPKSSRRSLLARARAATSAIAWLMPWIESWSASRMTGTIRPSSTATATPMLNRRLASRPASVQLALKVAVAPERLDSGLDHERDVAQARCRRAAWYSRLADSRSGPGPRRRPPCGRRRAGSPGPGSSGRRCPCASGSSAGGLRRRRPGS